MSILSESFIYEVENTILSGELIGKKTDNLMSGFSVGDTENILPNYELIKKSPINSYAYFASNAMGMISYGFYKANDGKIYIIVAFVNNITKIYLPEHLDLE